MKILSYGLLAAGLALSAPASAAAPASDRRAEKLFERLDANHDGKIDANEIENSRAAQFKRLDRNGDGVISEAEQNRATNRIRRRAALREARVAAQLERLDADHDQAVSEDEYVAAAPLKRADANSDGVVTREEFSAAVATLRDVLPERN